MTTPVYEQLLNEADVTSPRVPLQKLETVWFQVGGTICNLRCHHCFISCSPDNDKFSFLSLATIQRFLTEAKSLGASEYYFTGGEPFAHPQMCDILEAALAFGPTTVLTNATLLRDPVLNRLTALVSTALNRLEIRVSLDGYSAEMNDPVRGEGTFDRAMDGVQRLVHRGFKPIITITRTWGCSERDDQVLAGFRRMLQQRGYEAPRLKVLPLLKLGAEEQRGGGYCSEVRVTHEMMRDFDTSQLLCSNSRLVTDQGVWVCPILLDAPEARMGDSLSVTMGDYPLRHAACHTCRQFGAICANATTSARTESPAGKSG